MNEKHGGREVYVDKHMTSMKEYKVSILLTNKEFNSEKPRKYEEIREMFTKKCNDNV